MKRFVAFVGATVIVLWGGISAAATRSKPVDPIKAWADFQLNTCGPHWHMVLSKHPPELQKWLLLPPRLFEESYELTPEHRGDDLFIQVKTESVMSECGLNPENKDPWLRRNSLVLRDLVKGEIVAQATWYSGDIVGFMWTKDADGKAAIIFQEIRYQDWLVHGERCPLRQFVVRFRPPTDQPLNQ